MPDDAAIDAEFKNLERAFDDAGPPRPLLGGSWPQASHALRFAAARVAQLAAENKRLQNALKLNMCSHEHCYPESKKHRPGCVARAALEGRDA